MNKIMHLVSPEGSLYFDKYGIIVLIRQHPYVRFIDYTRVLSVDVDEIEYIEYPKTIETMKQDDIFTLKTRESFNDESKNYILTKHNILCNPDYKRLISPKFLLFSSEATIKDTRHVLAFFNDSIMVIEYSSVSGSIFARSFKWINKDCIKQPESKTYQVNLNDIAYEIYFYKEIDELLEEYISGLL